MVTCTSGRAARTLRLVLLCVNKWYFALTFNLYKSIHTRMKISFANYLHILETVLRGSNLVINIL